MFSWNSGVGTQIGRLPKRPLQRGILLGSSMSQINTNGTTIPTNNFQQPADVSNLSANFKDRKWSVFQPE